MKIKVCGLREQEDVIALGNSGIDYMGFIFHENSPRYARYLLEAESLKLIPKTISKVGVFVNSAVAEILETVEEFNLDMVQLHGDETPETSAFLRAQLPVTKAFRIDAAFDFAEQLHPYSEACDYFLFDTAGDTYGGNGFRFSWQLINQYALHVPFFLSGGIELQHAEELKQLKHPQLMACDINSRFELLPGRKDLRQVNAFVKSMKSNGHEFPGY